MATITYDESSFVVDGKRIWLVSGSVHYFRVPSALWRDRLLKAQRAGLNCISTYVAWDFHEAREGEWELGGDRDVAAFVRLAGELGLYVILRPGPYICAEWDCGGLPGWLSAKTGLNYRTSNAAFTHYYDKYLAHVLPLLADQQVTRGGNIVLIQNENEYYMTTMPDRLNYLEFISQLFRRSGFDIPIINCNGFTDPPLPDSVECVNGWQRLVQQCKRMRTRQPQAPLLVTELWCGGYDRWGGQHHEREAHDVARRAMEVLGCASQFNYYMWHGGTNFGFWGSRLPGCDDAYQTTSYDYDAPLAEGGGLTEKYSLTRLVNMLANHMGTFLAGCVMEEPRVGVHDSTSVLNATGPAGRWAVVTNNGRDDIDSALLSLPDGVELTVPLHPFGAAAVPVGLRLATTVTLDYANLTPLGLFFDHVLVLHGPPGWPARVSVNGEPICESVPESDEPKVITREDLSVVLIHSDVAMRTWLVEDTLVFGPDFVGEELEQVVPKRGSKQYALLTAEGKLTHKKVRAGESSRAKPRPPRLGTWKRVSVCTEPVSDDLEWQKLDRPRDVDRLGAHYGYAWYRIDVEQKRARKRNLLLPGCADRATIFANGNLVGTWGCGDGASRKPVPVNLKRGTNRLTLLIDNLGRVDYGSRLGELKGLSDHIYDAKPLRTRKFKLKQQETFSKRLVPRALSHMTAELEAGPIWSAEMDLTLTTVTPVHMSFRQLPHHLAVTCNDRVVDFFPCHGSNYGQVTFGSELRKGKNRLSLLLWGDVTAKVLDRIAFYTLEEPLSAGAAWGFRPWRVPEEGGPVVGKDQPAWYSIHFSRPDGQMPLFLRILGARKGQIFLNRHNVGRFWTIGPQQSYYLPACWLEDKNELLIFEESGRIPAKSRLEFRPLGPYKD